LPDWLRDIAVVRSMNEQRIFTVGI